MAYLRSDCDPIDCYEIVEQIRIYAGYEPTPDAVRAPVAVQFMPDITDDCDCPEDQYAYLYLTTYPRPCTRAFWVPVRRRICQGTRIDPVTCEEAVEALKRGL
jgi:hypothetical protein